MTRQPPPPNTVTLGRRLRDERVRQNLSIQEVSSRTRLGVSTISLVERDRHTPTHDTLQRWSTALDLDLDHLLHLGRVLPPDIEDTLFQYPGLWEVIRSCRETLDGTGQDITVDIRDDNHKTVFELEVEVPPDSPDTEVLLDCLCQTRDFNITTRCSHCGRTHTPTEGGHP